MWHVFDVFHAVWTVHLWICSQSHLGRLPLWIIMWRVCDMNTDPNTSDLDLWNYAWLWLFKTLHPAVWGGKKKNHKYSSEGSTILLNTPSLPPPPPFCPLPPLRGHRLMKTTRAQHNDWLAHVCVSMLSIAAVCKEYAELQCVHDGCGEEKKSVHLLADSLNPLAEWTMTWRKPYKPGVSSSGHKSITLTWKRWFFIYVTMCVSVNGYEIMSELF